VNEPGPTLLVGAQRSGTTALGAALSEAFAAAGSCFTVNGRLPYLLRRWWAEDDLEHQHLRADEVEHALRRRPATDTASGAWINRACAALRTGAIRAAHGGASASPMEEVRRICQEAYGDGPWGDKYNEYLLDLPWLGRAFPNARWIFVAREPADVVASMLAWRQEKVWNPRDAHHAAAKWATWNKRWLRFRSSIEPKRAFEIGYDQIGGEAGERLSDWLGLDLTPHLAGFEVRKAPTPVALTEEALAVRRSLADLGLLQPENEVARF